MNLYQLLTQILDETQKVSGTFPEDDHSATINADMRDEYIYIHLEGRTIAVRPQGTAFIIGG